jgi:hypothetical protein
MLQETMHCWRASKQRIHIKLRMDFVQVGLYGIGLDMKVCHRRLHAALCHAPAGMLINRNCLWLGINEGQGSMAFGLAISRGQLHTSSNPHVADSPSEHVLPSFFGFDRAS